LEDRIEEFRGVEENKALDLESENVSRDSGDGKVDVGSEEVEVVAVDAIDG